jgi:hypothetical protein
MKKKNINSNPMSTKEDAHQKVTIQITSRSYLELSEGKKMPVTRFQDFE